MKGIGVCYPCLLVCVHACATLLLIPSLNICQRQLQDLQERARRRGHHFTDQSQVKQIQRAHVLPPSSVRHLEAYEAQWQGRSGVVVDVEQNPAHRNFSHARLWPALVTHGCQWSLTRNRPATAREKFLIMGWPATPACTGECIYPDSVWTSLSRNAAEAAHLIGNGMALQPAASFLLWVLANVARVPIEKPSRGLSRLLDDDFASEKGNERNRALPVKRERKTQCEPVVVKQEKVVAKEEKARTKNKPVRGLSALLDGNSESMKTEEPGPKRARSRW